MGGQSLTDLWLRRKARAAVETPPVASEVGPRPSRHLGARACLVAAVLLPPIIPRPFGPAVRISALAGFAVAAWALCRPVGTHKRSPAGAIGSLGAVVLVWTAVATVFSESPRVSVVGRYGLYGGLVPLAVYVGVMATVRRTYGHRPARLVEIGAAMAAAATVSAFVVVLAARAFAEIDPSTGQYFTAPVGLQGHPNLSGAFLGTATPSFTYLILRNRSLLWRTLWLCGLVLNLAALAMTHSRGGILAAGCGLGAMGMALAKPVSRRITLATVGIVALGGVVVWSTWLQPRMQGAIHVPNGSSLFRAKTAQIRLWAWESAARSVADHPLVGSGPDTFILVHPRYRGLPDGAYLGSRLTGKPHNIFLEHAVDTGLPGGVAYVLLVSVGLRHGLRHRGRLPRESRLPLACFIGTLAAYGAQGLVSFDTPNLALPGWIALGAIAAVLDHGASAPTKLDSVSPSMRWRSWAIPMAAGLVVVACIPAVADLEFRSGRLDRAMRLNPWEAYYAATAGDRALAESASTPSLPEKEVLLRRALDDYHAALSIQGPNVYPTTAIARTYGRWAAEINPERYVDADRWWQTAVRLDPRNPQLRMEHAAMLYSWASATGEERAASAARAESAAAAAIVVVRSR